jgi:hypothetical protein
LHRGKGKGELYLSGLSINRGCFNCKKYKNCRGSIDSEKGIDPKEIQKGRNNIPYRAGCCCQNYEFVKEKVLFT